MFKWARNILCGVSLLLFLALLIYGICVPNTAQGRWLKRSDKVPYGGRELSTPHFYYFNLSGKQFVFGHWRNPEFVKGQRDFAKELVADLQAMRAQMAMTLERAPATVQVRMKGRIGDVDDQIRRVQKQQHTGSWFAPDGFHFGYHDGLHSTPISKIPSFGGIKYDSLPTWRPPAVAFRCFLPIWYVLPLLLMAPAWRGFSIWRSIRRKATYYCQNCGYDLRASPNRCPECGTAASSGIRP